MQNPCSNSSNKNGLLGKWESKSASSLDEGGVMQLVLPRPCHQRVFGAGALCTNGRSIGEEDYSTHRSTIFTGRPCTVILQTTAWLCGMSEDPWIQVQPCFHGDSTHRQ